MKCEHCEDGQYHLTECPRSVIGNELTEAINFAGMCGKGDWPVTGGLLDQSAWFMDLMQRLKHERNLIESGKDKK